MNEYIIKSNLKKRILATILDYGLFFLMFYVYLMYFGKPNNEGGYTVNGFAAIPIPIVWFCYFVLIEATMGATVGHYVSDLKVVKINRQEIGFTEAFKRHLLDPIDILLYGIPAFLTIKYSEKHQRIGDMVAQTIVINLKDFEQN
jgi:uncharacterized RDD family membrane protein YckC